MITISVRWLAATVGLVLLAIGAAVLAVTHQSSTATKSAQTTSQIKDQQSVETAKTSATRACSEWKVALGIDEGPADVARAQSAQADYQRGLALTDVQRASAIAPLVTAYSDFASNIQAYEGAAAQFYVDLATDPGKTIGDIQTQHTARDAIAGICAGLGAG